MTRGKEESRRRFLISSVAGVAAITIFGAEVFTNIPERLLQTTERNPNPLNLYYPELAKYRTKEQGDLNTPEKLVHWFNFSNLHVNTAALRNLFLHGQYLANWYRNHAQQGEATINDKQQLYYRGLQESRTTNLYIVPYTYPTPAWGNPNQFGVTINGPDLVTNKQITISDIRVLDKSLKGATSSLIANFANKALAVESMQGLVKATHDETGNHFFPDAQEVYAASLGYALSSRMNGDSYQNYIKNSSGLMIVPDAQIKLFTVTNQIYNNMPSVPILTVK